ncbi:hybrid sensor histidine kinase/response regulator [Corallococcus caeni]|uniref:histidine kinase n=1 Tax=Corallococcus caeni TaxID=3082388 RepID=A0ABQ6QTF8_9BACT|nr:response regulator [Corallococcus sp. NO1]
MDRDRLAQALLDSFLEELEGHVVSLNRDLLALEQAPARAKELIPGLLRTLHSVKGASRAASAAMVENACHRMEEVLEPLIHGRTPTPDLFELCFATVDALDDAGRRLAARQELAGSPLEALLPQLEQAAHGLPPQAPAPVPGPSPKPSQPPASEEAEPELPVPAQVSGETLPVRVSGQKLDALLGRSGELRVAMLRLEGHAESLEALRDDVAGLRETVRGTKSETTLRRVELELARVARVLAQDRRALFQSSTGLDDEVRRSRMLPFEEGCTGLERAARDVAHGLGRRVRMEVHGGGLDLDRSLLQSLREPLLHLVRNAVAHGLEAPEERVRHGKPEEGRVVLSARLRGSRVEVAVEDDGRGLDLEALRERARARGLEVPEDDEEAARLVFLPGLSTAAKVTAVSGRGVGLDVVRAQVEALRGSVEVAFKAGQGTRFTLDVPLTLSTLRVLLVAVGGQTLALASEGVDRLLRLSPSDVREVEGRMSWVTPDALVPLASLAAVLDLPAGPPKARPSAVVLSAGTAQAALVVDEVIAEQEVLVRSLGSRVKRARHVAAAAVMPDGRMALLLSPASLVRAAGGRPSAHFFPTPKEQAARRRVVLADDSPTTRMLEQSILEGAGYDVTACADGAEAWERLQAGGADAMVMDVEMPRMDGFQVTEAVRASPRFGRVPVVLVTSREKPEDKARGLQAGASAYIVKSAFDPTSLLETLRRLL